MGAREKRFLYNAKELGHSTLVNNLVIKNPQAPIVRRCEAEDWPNLVHQKRLFQTESKFLESWTPFDKLVELGIYCFTVRYAIHKPNLEYESKNEGQTGVFRRKCLVCALALVGPIHTLDAAGTDAVLSKD